MGRHEEPPRGLLDPGAQRLRLPFGVPEFIDRIASGTANEVGRRTLIMLITTWDMAGGGPFAASSIATVGLSKTVDAVRKNKFVVLPHPKVLEMYRQKSLDHDRWIDGLRRYQASLSKRAG